MNVLVISDIHANLDALTAVLNDAQDFDAVWCLGDIIGYGPEPNECIQVVKKLPGLVCVLGNHDTAALGRINTLLFNQEAQQSMTWLKANLTDESIKFLEGIHEKEVLELATLVHGSPFNPVWEYILDPYIAKSNFQHFSTPFCFVGHTHQPIICSLKKDNEQLMWKQPKFGFEYVFEEKTILNPGSVGQPRDYDPRASYGLFNTETKSWKVKRVEYDIATAQDKIIQKKLPTRHAQRLSGGW